MKHKEKVEILAELRHEVFRNIVKDIVETGEVSEETLKKWTRFSVPWEKLHPQMKELRRQWARNALRAISGQFERPETRRRLMEVL